MKVLGKQIQESFCSRFNAKINGEESYDAYLSSLTKNQIERLLKISAVLGDDDSKLAHVLLVSMHKKNSVLEEFKQNSKNIYKNLIENVSEDILNQLEVYLKNYNKSIMELDLAKLKYSLHFIEVLNENCLAKIKYSKKENKLYLYTPKELQLILKEIIKDKKLRNKIKNNSIIKKNLYNLIATYGVISVKELANIYNNIYGNIEEAKLVKRIMIDGIFSCDIKLVTIEDESIVYGIGFEDEDMALEFYYSLPNDLECKIFTKEEYEEIGEGVYHYNFEEYNKLYDFLDFNLGMIEDEIDDFDDMFIMDYLYSYQLDADTAKKNLSNNLNKIFGMLDFNSKAHISKLILSIARNYPNFNYKGYSYNELKKAGEL